MKKTHILFTLFFASLMVLSCSTNYNDINSDHTEIIGFTLSSTLELPLSESTPEINFPLPYFVSSVSSSERTFKVVVVESELSEESYSFDANVVIPANERSGTIIFTALNISLTNEYQPLVLAFEPTSEISSGSQMNIALKTND
jgi:hypothetical protein